ncbi:MAG: DUF4331 family protein [Gammaproteobacteria bacterium]|jgi:hypothetical protein|nr:DUF4331 family protein [Gammaproteobacteria bacterium]
MAGRRRLPGLRTVALLLFGLSTFGQAADHRDSPNILDEPAADIADIFAWTTSDATRVNLALTVPAALFSDAVQYVIHVESSPAFGESGSEVQIICEFEADQTLECWVGTEDYVTGDASSEVGLESASGRVRAFAGERDDPFFFNASGFRATLDIVNDAAPNLDFDGAGCPILDEATSMALINALQDNGEAVDNFAGLTAGSLVLQIDASLLTGSGNILAVWASTHRRG